MIALSDWVLWGSHHAQSPMQSLLHPVIHQVAPSPTSTPTPSPSPGGSGGTSNTTAIVVAFVALAGSVAATVVTLVVGLRSARAADRSATAANTAAGVAEASRKDLEARSRREEVMLNVRWASELAISHEKPKRDLGIEQLQVLRVSPLADQDVRLLIYAALKAVMEPIERRAGADLDVTVAITAEGVVGAGPSGLPSEVEQSEKGGDDG